MRRLFHEPLLHFLLIAGLLFVAYDLVSGRDGGKIIHVGEGDLLRHLQFRQKKFDAETSGRVLASMSPDEVRNLAREYVREEAVYREAKAMHLDRDDYVARMRLVQQLEYVVKSGVPTEVDVSDRDIADYYEAHKAEYYVEPTLTFTHVFVSGRDRTGDEMEKAVARVGRVLQSKSADPMRVGILGDRFLYHINYVDKPRSELVGHFGAAMIDRLFASEANGTVWQGPFESPHGKHYVLLMRKEGGYQPPLEAVRDKVEESFRYQAMQERYAASVREIVNKYEVRSEYPLPDRTGGQS